MDWETEHEHRGKRPAINTGVALDNGHISPLNAMTDQSESLNSATVSVHIFTSIGSGYMFLFVY